jgi:hypothetical protein
VYIRVYGLEIQSVMVVFSTQLCELLPLSSSRWFKSSPPLPLSLYTVYTYTVCRGGGGYGALGLTQISTCPITGQKFWMTTFCIAFYESYLSTFLPHPSHDYHPLWQSINAFPFHSLNKRRCPAVSPPLSRVSTLKRKKLASHTWRSHNNGRR